MVVGGTSSSSCLDGAAGLAERAGKGRVHFYQVKPVPVAIAIVIFCFCFTCFRIAFHFGAKGIKGVDAGRDRLAAR